VLIPPPYAVWAAGVNDASGLAKIDRYLTSCRDDTARVAYQPAGGVIRHWTIEEKNSRAQ